MNMMGYDYDNVIGAFHKIDLFATTRHSYIFIQSDNIIIVFIPHICGIEQFVKTQLCCILLESLFQLNK